MRIGIGKQSCGGSKGRINRVKNLSLGHKGIISLPRAPYVGTPPAVGGTTSLLGHHWLVGGTTKLGAKHAYQGTTDRHSYQRIMLYQGYHRTISSPMDPPWALGTTSLSRHHLPVRYTVDRGAPGTHSVRDTTSGDNHELSAHVRKITSYQGHNRLIRGMTVYRGTLPAYQRNHWQTGSITGVAGLPLTYQISDLPLTDTNGVSGIFTTGVSGILSTGVSSVPSAYQMCHNGSSGHHALAHKMHT